MVTDEEEGNEEPDVTCSFLPLPDVQGSEEDLNRSAINAEDALKTGQNWATRQ